MNLVDSSGWLEYFANEKNADFFAAAIEDTDNLIVSTINLYEVFKRILQQRDENLALQAIALMQQGNPLLGFLPIIILMLPLVFLCYKLAKEKGKDTSLYTILGIIPILNYFILLYLIGASDENLNNKIDQMITLLKNNTK